MKTRSSTGFTQLALGTALCTVLAACGGGGGGSGSGGGGGAPVNTSQLTGKAIDGYLPGVTVCFDNGQGQCDTTLPTTVTDSNGNYTLNTTASEVGKSLLAIVPPGTTDVSSGTTFPQGFVLAALVTGTNQNITPVTSIVVAQMAKGASQDQATATALQVSGATDVNADYIAGGNAAVASFAQQTVADIQSYAGGTSSTGTNNVLNAVVATGSPAAVTQASVALQAATTSTSTTPVDASVVLATPLASVDGYLTSPTPLSTFSLQNATGSPVRTDWTLNGGSLTLPQELHQGGWVASPQAGLFDSFQTGAGIQSIYSYTSALGGGYVMMADGTFSAYKSSDQMHPGYTVTSSSPTITATDSLTNDTVSISYTSGDVSGQTLASGVNQLASNAIVAAMKGNFPSGTTAYFATVKHTNDQAIITTGGIDPAWVNGADYMGAAAIVWPDNAAMTGVMALADTSQQYSSVQQAVGVSVDVSYNVQQRHCIAMNIQAGGVVQLAATGYSGCSYTGLSLPQTGSWTTYAKNANVMVISLPQSVANLPIDSTIKYNTAQGGNLIVALQGTNLVSGFMIPASVSQTFEQFQPATTDLIATSMHAAAAAIGITMNP